MSKFWAIVKKELYRFFTDKKLVLSLILPGLLIFIVYTIMGNLIPSIGQSNIKEGYEFKYAYVNKAEKFSEYTKLGLELQKYKYLEFEIANDEASIAQAKQDVLAKKYDILVSFEEDFDYKVTQYILDYETNPQPKVEFFYASQADASLFSYNLSVALLDSAYNLHTYVAEKTDLSPQDGTMIKVMASILPMLVVSLLFSHVLSIAPESIAGEKERGTIATLLITPISRTQLAAGKITALSIVSLVGAVCSFIGTALSLPNIMKSSAAGTFTLGFTQYAMIFLLIVTTVMMITALMSIVSTVAKSVKEANSAMGITMPLFLIFSILAGFFPVNSIGIAFIPVYNVSTAITQIINQSLTIEFLIVTIIMNLVYTAAAIFVVVKMFNNEKIMFNR